MATTNTKKAQVITHLLTGETIECAAQKAGVTERTVYRWLTEPAFKDELHNQERQVLDACSWRLVSMTRLALDALENVLTAPAGRVENARRLAAVSVLELALKYMDILTFETRLERLERQVFNGQK